MTITNMAWVSLQLALGANTIPALKQPEKLQRKQEDLVSTR